MERISYEEESQIVIYNKIPVVSQPRIKPSSPLGNNQVIIKKSTKYKFYTQK